MVAPTNVRFPDAVDQGLADYARQAGAKKSTVVVNAVREWLRMQTHAGIIFVPTITGERRAALVVGPKGWNVAEAWVQHDKAERTTAELAGNLGLSAAGIQADLAYRARY